MLKKRIDTLASLAKGYARIADIGCDHGYTIKLAIEKYDVKYAYAIDINEKPLEKAKETLKKAALQSKVSFFLGDGLSGFTGNFDCAIISGMGGRLIEGILEKSQAKFLGKALILEPQSENYLVRKWLMANGFKIELELALMENGKYYEIIKAIPGKMELDSLDLKYGPFLRREKNEAFIKHYEALANKLNNAYLKSNKNNNLLKEIEEIKKLLA